MYTPVSVKSPTPNQAATAPSSRAHTPGLNLQTLSLLDHQPPLRAEQMSAIVEEPANAISKFAESPSIRYIQPEVEDNDISESITHVTLPDGAELPTNEECSMFVKKTREVYRGAKYASKEKSIHRPSPRCAWPTMEEAVADRRWKSQRWHGKRKEIDDGKRRTTTSTKVSNAEDPSGDWQPGPVTYLEALEFERQQIEARSQKRRVFRNVDFSCNWFCVSMIPILMCIQFCEIDFEQDSCGVQGGMTILIDHCPGCNHLRCPLCTYEVIKMRIGR